MATQKTKGKKIARSDISVETSIAFVKAVRMAQGRTVASNLFVDRILEAGEYYQYADPRGSGGAVMGGYTASNDTTMTGTVVITPRPGKPFGREVRYRDLVYSVPKSYRGLTDAAIVLEHPNFGIRIDDKGRWIISGKVKCVVEEIPTDYGWYKVDESSGIPHGPQITFSSGQTSAEIHEFYRENPDLRHTYPFLGAQSELHLHKDELGHSNGYIGPITRRKDDTDHYGSQHQFVCSPRTISITYGGNIFGYEDGRISSDVNVFYVGHIDRYVLEQRGEFETSIARVLRSVDGAEESVGKLSGVIDEETVKPIKELIRVAKELEMT